MEVSTVETQHLTCQRKLLLPEFASFDYGEKLSAVFKEPETITPYPVTLWELSQERHEESKLVGDEVDDSFMVGSGTSMGRLRMCVLKLML